jgi:dTDP-glucose 4,6-dehydratase
MRILITGGAGFLGSHLVDLMIGRGHSVTVVDDFSTGTLDNLAATRSRRLRIINADAGVAPRGRYDRVYHLASPASPEAYGRMQIGTLLVNSMGTKRLLDIACASRARFLLASTSEVYGDPLQHPQRESYWGNVDPIGPRSQYDEGKRFAEALVVAYVRERGANARIARIFNSYGPRMRVDDGRMPAAFIAAALRGDPIEVHGDGAQTRSLCFAGDTVRGLVAAMERGRAGQVYNIGRADEITVRAFAERVKRVSQSNSPIISTSAREADIQRRRPDTRKSARELGWRARTTLTKGLRDTIAWYRERLSR